MKFETGEEFPAGFFMSIVQKGCHACNFIARVLFCTRRRKTTAQHSPLSHPWMIGLKKIKLIANWFERLAFASLLIICFHLWG